MAGRLAGGPTEHRMHRNFSHRATLLALALLGAASGCATAGKPQELPRWPLPPEKARVKFVRSFYNEDQLRKGFALGAMRLFVPASPDAEVKQPTGLALSPDEKILFVSCASASRVLRVDLAKGRMGVFATEEGKRPSSPFGVAVDGAGNVFVSDTAQNAIWVYGPGGEFLRRFGTDRLDRPAGLALDRRRQLLYVVAGSGVRSEAHRVEVFSLGGDHVRTIGKRGAGPGEFNFPANLTVAKDGSLYVVDMLNFRVQIFDPEGQLAGMFGTIGAGQPGTFDKAKSVALDTFGNVYVVDSQQGWVQVFNPKFQPLMAFGGRFKATGYFLLPTDIVIDSKNTIYVADFAKGTVNEYQLVDTTAEDSFLPAEPAGPAAPPSGTPGPPSSPGR